jgi:flagellin
MSVLQKIKDTFNSNTVLDFFKSSANISSEDVRYSNYNTSKITYDVLRHDVEDNTSIQLTIHSGADASDEFPISYDYLRLSTIGLLSTNVKTEDSATSAIDEISAALKVINTQRSAFGAYQNRLEHASLVNANVAENTQASESVVRDTDMATEMVRYSNVSILAQAGQAVLAQANQSKQGVLRLLNP